MKQLQRICGEGGSNAVQLRSLDTGLATRLIHMSTLVATWRVALPTPLPQLFDYLPPDARAAQAGVRVRVPLGRREVIGIVVGEGQADAQGFTLKPVIEVLDATPVLSGELWQSLTWLARYLHAPLGEVLSTALPASLRRGEALPDTRVLGWALTEAGHTAVAGLRAGQPRDLAQRLVEAPLADAQVQGGARSALRSLHKRGLVHQITLDAPASSPAQAGPPLHEEQAAAVAAVQAHSGYGAFLLEGVTGSGKTEVYLRLIAQCLAEGKQAMVLVPEIGLTPQMLARFNARLGVPVYALHSGLNDTERAKVWALASSGQARVIVGTRSAVFTPLPNPGIIIIDEEHDSSYKQLDGIRYHARDFATVRARAMGVPIVLGSATPALETLHNAEAQRYTHLRLRQRAGAAKPPQVRVLDVRKRKMQAGLSDQALQAISDSLAAGGQALVFKNRRGYAPVLLCHDCGYSSACPRCSTPERSTPMTVHAHGKRLQCHHCGLRRAAPPACPDCGGLGLQPQGVGTERIEALLAEHFAETPVLRIDKGSTQGRDALHKALSKLGNAPGILIGTQMLAKGHDLPNLTLVVVVGIDEGLYSADFRSGEKLAQLLIQVAGRAGRADKPGHVLLQTHHPEHPLLQTLLSGGYPAFAETELALRQAALLPPYAHLALLRAEARQVEPITAFLHSAREHLHEATPVPAAQQLPSVQLHGPLPAPMPRRAGYQRQQLIIASEQRQALHHALNSAMPHIYALPQARSLRWSLDVDPADLY